MDWMRDGEKNSSCHVYHAILTFKRFIECRKDVGLGLVEGKHHFHMSLQLLMPNLSPAGPFSSLPWRREEEDIIVLQSEPWVLVDIEELSEAALHDWDFV